MKKRSIKVAIGCCLLGLAWGLRGPDGNLTPWMDTMLTVIASVCGALIVGLVVLLWMVCRDAQHDIELSAERDAAGTVYEPRGIPPHDPPTEESAIARVSASQEWPTDLDAIYLAGLSRGRSLVERAHRLRPAHEVCGTAE